MRYTWLWVILAILWSMPESIHIIITGKVSKIGQFLNKKVNL